MSLEGNQTILGTTYILSITYNCKKDPLLLANFTELANVLTINPLLDQLTTAMTYQLPLHLKQRNKITHHSSARCLNRLIIAC